MFTLCRLTHIFYNRDRVSSGSDSKNIVYKLLPLLATNNNPSNIITLPIDSLTCMLLHIEFHQFTGDHHLRLMQFRANNIRTVYELWIK